MSRARPTQRRALERRLALLRPAGRLWPRRRARRAATRRRCLAARSARATVDVNAATSVTTGAGLPAARARKSVCSGAREQTDVTCDSVTSYSQMKVHLYPASPRSRGRPLAAGGRRTPPLKPRRRVGCGDERADVGQSLSASTPARRRRRREDDARARAARARRASRAAAASSTGAWPIRVARRRRGRGWRRRGGGVPSTTATRPSRTPSARTAPAAAARRAERKSPSRIEPRADRRHPRTQRRGVVEADARRVPERLERGRPPRRRA